MRKTPDIILREIKKVRESGGRALSLSRSRGLGGVVLYEVPEELFELEELETLNLSGHMLTAVPDSIARLRNLQSLDLSDNKLTGLPDSFARLQNLRALDLSRNELAEFPAPLLGLRDLSVLYLGVNRIASLPDALGDLRNLTDLRLWANALTSFPESVTRLPELRVLSLGQNRIGDAPASLARLQKLTGLYLFDNKFTSIPEEVYRLGALEELSFGNYAPRPKKPKGEAEGNRIKEVSPEIVRLGRLSQLELKGNPVEIPPPEVVAEGAAAVRNYFRQLEAQGKDYLFEAKLLIVGEAGAGKTTLANKIENPDYELRDEDSTKGIEVRQWAFRMEDGRPFRVNIWDFGGQEIYHTTHQFFLTRRSLYVLVADSRKEDTDFYYWLNVVELLSDSSPLLIVKNEKQDRRRDINERQLRGQFSNLKEALRANFSTGRGVPEILTEIKHHVRSLPHVGALLPKSWVKVREALEGDPRNYISFDEYLAVCERNGFAEMADKLQLSGYLHDIGVCLHFQADRLLNKTVILKPKWGTDAVYKVLDNGRVIGNLGRFTRADLAAIWHEPEYAGMRDELLQLMINFKLCYELPESGHYTAPQLLTENQPRYGWDEAHNLLLRYAYEFMPKGIIVQFIVAMHRLIAKEHLVWKSGVVLEKDGTRAEVVEYYDKRELRVRVAGRRPRELMTVVTYELDKIHASYNERLRYKKLVPCNCAECRGSREPHFYLADVLARFRDDRQPLIQCQKSYEMVAVSSLVDDAFDRGGAGRSPRGRGPRAPAPARDQVFISYSHSDRVWLERLRKMLAPLRRGQKISFWDDTEIRAGEKWQERIEQALGSARVAVLLVTPDFLASDFIAEHELPPLLASAERDGLKILWVAVSHSLYRQTEIAQYQAANDPARPLDSLGAAELNRALVGVCEEILRALDLPVAP